MKKVLISALASLALLVTSCSGDGDGGSASTGSLSATIDGQDWSTNITVASITSIDLDGGSTTLQIIATKTDQTSVTLNIPLDDLSEGSHVYNGFDPAGSLLYVTPTFDIYDSAQTDGTFTINITEFDLENGRISGTFSGTLVSFDETQTVTITNGAFNDVLLITNSFYSDGAMSLSRDNGTAFEMDEDDSDGKYLLINQNSASSSLSLFGYNVNISSDFGIYTISMPLDVQPGTYSLTESGFGAGVSNSDNQSEFSVTSGSITITSHNGNNLVGTFNFTASNGSTTVNVNNGSFDVTHK